MLKMFLLHLDFEKTWVKRNLGEVFAQVDTDWRLFARWIPNLFRALLPCTWFSTSSGAWFDFNIDRSIPIVGHVILLTFWWARDKVLLSPTLHFHRLFWRYLEGVLFLGSALVHPFNDSFVCNGGDLGFVNGCIYYVPRRIWPWLRLKVPSNLGLFHISFRDIHRLSSSFNCTLNRNIPRWRIIMFLFHQRLFAMNVWIHIILSSHIRKCLWSR